MFDMFGFLRDEGISPEIITEIQKFRERFPVEGTLSSRVPEPRYLYYGKDVWEEAATSIWPEHSSRMRRWKSLLSN